MRRVPPGWTTDRYGYFFDEAAMVEFATAAFTYEAEAAAWETAYWELDSKFAAFVTSADLHVKSIEAKYDVNQQTWKERESALEKSLKRAQRRASLPGLGVFAGYGAGSGGSPGFTVGVGLIWRIGP